MAKRGARILLLCRSFEKTKRAIEDIKLESGNSNIAFYKLDLASLTSVRACAAEITDKEIKIDILINNAGVMLCPHWKTEDGFDMQFGTNHLGHFLLTELLIPMLKKSAISGFHPRIVTVSSKAHEWGQIYWEDMNFEKRYSKIDAYHQSKLANVMHSRHLAKRLTGTTISTYSLHPGVVNTDLVRHGNRQKWFAVMMKLGKPFFKTPLQGAQTTLYCVLDEKIK